MMIPEHTAVNNASADAGLDAADLFFVALQLELDAIKDEDAARAVAQDASAEFVVAFKRLLKQRVRKYLDDRD
jgi:hypothetical protein